MYIGSRQLGFDFWSWESEIMVVVVPLNFLMKTRKSEILILIPNEIVDEKFPTK